MSCSTFASVSPLTLYVSVVRSCLCAACAAAIARSLAANRALSSACCARTALPVAAATWCTPSAFRTPTTTTTTNDVIVDSVTMRCWLTLIVVATVVATATPQQSARNVSAVGRVSINRGDKKVVIRAKPRTAAAGTDAAEKKNADAEAAKAGNGRTQQYPLALLQILTAKILRDFLKRPTNTLMVLTRVMFVDYFDISSLIKCQF